MLLGALTVLSGLMSKATPAAEAGPSSAVAVLCGLLEGFVAAIVVPGVAAIVLSIAAALATSGN